MQILRLSFACLVAWALLGLVTAGHHGGGFGGPLGVLLGVGLLAKLLEGGHGHHHHHHHHVQYVPIPVKHHGHGYHGGHEYY